MPNLRPYILSCLLAILLSLSIPMAFAQAEAGSNQATNSLPSHQDAISQLSATNQAKASNGNLEQQSDIVADADTVIVENPPEVGKHVKANMDAGSMVLSLLMVVALIVVCALVLKRFNFAQQHTKHLKMVANLSLGAKERVVVVQVGEKQLVLGVTSQQVNLLDTLAEPLTIASDNPSPLAGNVLAFLQKVNTKQKSNSHKTRINQQPERT